MLSTMLGFELELVALRLELCLLPPWMLSLLFLRSQDHCPQPELVFGLPFELLLDARFILQVILQLALPCWHSLLHCHFHPVMSLTPPPRPRGQQSPPQVSGHPTSLIISVGDCFLGYWQSLLYTRGSTFSSSNSERTGCYPSGTRASYSGAYKKVLKHNQNLIKKTEVIYTPMLVF